MDGYFYINNHFLVIPATDGLHQPRSQYYISAESWIAPFISCIHLILLLSGSGIDPLALWPQPAVVYCGTLAALKIDIQLLARIRRNANHHRKSTLCSARH